MKQSFIKTLLIILIFLSPFLMVGGCVQQVKQPGLPKGKLEGVGRGLKLDLLTSGLLDPEGHPVAFKALPKNRLGYVDWVAAINEGVLDPLESLEPDVPPVAPLKLDIVFKTNHAYPIPDVVFPHEPHTLWLACNNCHPILFSMKQGANPVGMDRIIKGEFCGRCHGVVAFPIFDCMRCHSRPK
jgi:c(7)-type cytochrome triheme protein